MNSEVIIVDDSLTVRMDLAEEFESHGLNPILCSTAAEAREAFSRGEAGCVVLDVFLPDGDGVELLRELRDDSRHAGLPVLMLSSEAEVHDRVRGMKMGANEYVGKPYDRTYVAARVRELMRRSSPDAPVDTRRVLVIDDSATYRGVLSDALAAEGYTVDAAASGEEGLRMAGEIRPHAILVDGNLPGEDGPTVIRRVRLDPALSRTPCILLTASEEMEAELTALDSGADEFIRKEESTDIVLARLAAVLRISTAGADAGQRSFLGTKRILAVDDSETYLHEVEHALKSEDYDVVLARSGDEAIELLTVQPVDCILMDLEMPAPSGQETCRRIKEAPGLREIPLMILTASEDREKMVDGLNAGADDYASKSSDFRVLKARVEALVRRKNFEHESRRVRERLMHAELDAADARASREIAEQRAVMLEELERKNQELEAFSYTVSHDLQAPLRGIDGFSRALLEDYESLLDDQAKQWLQEILGAAGRMTELIGDLLSLSRVSSAEIHIEQVALSQLACKVGAELAKSHPGTPVALAVQKDLNVTADPKLLRIVLENLIGNAFKYSSKSEHPRVEVGVTDVNGEAVYYVSDNGAGFDMKYAHKLFLPFQRLHGDAEFTGTGIGLATVHRILERHGGRVWAEGTIGKGAAIYFSFQSRVEREKIG